MLGPLGHIGAGLAYLATARRQHSSDQLTARQLAWSPVESLLPRGLTMTWFGTAGFRLAYQDTVIWIDPYVTRLRLAELVRRRVVPPSEDAVATWIDRADAVLVGHTHFDHALDVPAIARRFGCPVYGSASLEHLMALHGLAERTVVVEPQRDYQVGPFRFHFVPSIHSKLQLGLGIPYSGELTCEHVDELTPQAYRCGQVWGVFVEVAGVRIYHQGSADLLEDEIKDRGVDLFLCGASGRRFTPRYVERIVRALDPKLIIPTHYDDFFRPLGGPSRFSFNVNLTGFADEVRAVAKDLPLHTLEVGVPVGHLSVGALYASIPSSVVRKLHATSCMLPLLTSFRSSRPRFQVSQARPHTWLAAVPAEIEQIGETVDGDSIVYDLPSDPCRAGAGARTRLIGEIVDRYFASSYANDTAPDELIHVTCGGYLQPSGAQRLVATRAWDTRVTHAYRLGGHAAVPAIQSASQRMGAAQRVDIAHTELGTLTCGPATPSDEGPVSDGMIRYSMVPDTTHGAGLRVLGIHHCEVAGVVDAMTRQSSAPTIPEVIASALRGFVRELFTSAGVDLGRLREATFAVHPSDVWVIDRVIDVLMLRDDQLAASRGVLHDQGNMLSATLPHIWMRLLDAPAITPGTLIPSIAFGPGMTLWGALLEKR